MVRRPGSAIDGGRFDPRNNERRSRTGDCRLRARSASDTAMVTTWGTATLDQMTVWADEVSSVA